MAARCERNSVAGKRYSLSRGGDVVSEVALLICHGLKEGGEVVEVPGISRYPVAGKVLDLHKVDLALDSGDLIRDLVPLLTLRNHASELFLLTLRYF